MGISRSLPKEQVERIRRSKEEGNSIYNTSRSLGLPQSTVYKHCTERIGGRYTSDSELCYFKMLLDSLPAQLGESLQLDQSIAEGISRENYCISMLQRLSGMGYGAKLRIITAGLGIKKDHRQFLSYAKKMGIIKGEGNMRDKRAILTERGNKLAGLIDKLYSERIEVESADFIEQAGAETFPAHLSLIVPAQLINYYMKAGKAEMEKGMRFQLADGRKFLNESRLLERLKESEKYKAHAYPMNLYNIMDYLNGKILVSVQPLIKPWETRVAIEDEP